MVLMSVVWSAPAMAKRRPLTSTRFRWAPKPRMLSVAVPPGTVLAVWPLFCDPTNWGEVPSSCSALTVPDSLNSSASTTATGVGALKPREARREPVTTTVSTVEDVVGRGRRGGLRLCQRWHKQQSRGQDGGRSPAEVVLGVHVVPS
jgi:hypothetical protein